MARSVKKGPFVDAHLMKKVEALNKAHKKEVIKTWSAGQLSSPNSSNIPSPSITEESIFQFMLLRI